MEGHRVQKLLSNYGHCSRRKAEALIEEGRVKVNGKAVGLGDKATEADQITVDGQPVAQEKKRYLIFHKPIHCATALEDKFQKTIMAYVKVKERVFPVGRLDFNTAGLLLLTNDGDFANSIMHPRYEIKKTYEVETERQVGTREIIRLEHGVKLEDGITAPARIEKVSANKMRITIHEGKNKIIKRMMKAVGHNVKNLKRISVGKLDLGDLPAGKHRDLTEDEKKLIFKR